jgi:WD40 repeat protein
VCGGEAQTLTVFKTNLKRVSELNPIALLRGHERSVECVATKNNNSVIVSGGFDKCLKIWKLEAGLTIFNEVL